MHEDLISRQALIAEIMRRGIYPPGVRHAIENAPAIDAVPVVRCKDCIFFEINEENIDIDNWYHLCRNAGCGVRKVDFCSYGERREAD